jgi:hypothetical protein
MPSDRLPLPGMRNLRAAMAPGAHRAGALIDQAVSHGTRAMRAHVDVAPPTG